MSGSKETFCALLYDLDSNKVKKKTSPIDTLLLCSLAWLANLDSHSRIALHLKSTRVGNNKSTKNWWAESYLHLFPWNDGSQPVVKDDMNFIFIRKSYNKAHNFCVETTYFRFVKAILMKHINIESTTGKKRTQILYKKRFSVKHIMLPQWITTLYYKSCDAQHWFLSNQFCDSHRFLCGYKKKQLPPPPTHQKKVIIIGSICLLLAHTVAQYMDNVW